MKYEDWAKREDRLRELYPNRTPGKWLVDYKSMAITLAILIGGMTACVYRYHGSFDWLF